MNISFPLLLAPKSPLPFANRNWRAALAGAVAGALLATLAPAAVELTREAWRSAVRELVIAPTPATDAYPPRPLSPEWRWSPPGVDVEQMFRKKR